MKRNLHASKKSIDPGQPAQSAQADLGGNFLLYFLHVKGPVCYITRSTVTQNHLYTKH